MKYFAAGASLTLDPELCIGCGLCTEVCPHQVFEKNCRGAVEIIKPGLCMECGACEKNCPTKAVKVSAGVGCAQAVVLGFIRGTQPQCYCEKKPNAK